MKDDLRTLCGMENSHAAIERRSADVCTHTGHANPVRLSAVSWEWYENNYG